VSWEEFCTEKQMFSVLKGNNRPAVENGAQSTPPVGKHSVRFLFESKQWKLSRHFSFRVNINVRIPRAYKCLAVQSIKCFSLE